MLPRDAERSDTPDGTEGRDETDEMDAVIGTEERTGFVSGAGAGVLMPKLAFAATDTVCAVGLIALDATAVESFVGNTAWLESVRFGSLIKALHSSVERSRLRFRSTRIFLGFCGGVGCAKLAVVSEGACDTAPCFFAFGASEFGLTAEVCRFL